MQQNFGHLWPEYNLLQIYGCREFNMMHWCAGRYQLLIAQRLWVLEFRPVVILCGSYIISSRQRIFRPICEII